MKCGNHLADINMPGLSPVEREQRELHDDVYICVCVAFIRRLCPWGTTFALSCTIGTVLCMCASGQTCAVHASVSGLTMNIRQ